MNKLQVSADKTAVVLSIACALHCLVLPLALVLMPSIATLSLADESFHQMLLLFVVPVSVLAMTLGCRKHRSRLVATSGLLGLGLLLSAVLLGHDLLGELGEKALTVLGAACLVFGHIQNYKRCKKSECQQDGCH